MSDTDGSSRENAFQQALKLHRDGDLVRAATLYEHVLEDAGARAFDAFHMLGVLRAQQGRLEEAIVTIGYALAVRQTAAALSNFANALSGLGRWSEAMEHYNAALKLNPHHAGALKGRGDALLATGYEEEAIVSFTSAVGSQPNMAEAWNGRGAAFLASNQYSQALDDCDHAVRLEAEFAEAMYNRGYALFGLGRFSEAVSSFDRALLLKPGDATALNQKGMALRRLGRPRDAIKSYDAALAITPKHPDILSNRGSAYHDLGQYGDAIESYDESLAVDPLNPKTLNNRAVTLHQLNHLSDAKRDYEAALTIKSDDAEARTNLGVLLRDMGDHDKAIDTFAVAIGVAPDHANAHWNMGVSRLLLGDFEKGWPLYDWRKRLPKPVEMRHYPQPSWTGREDVKGKTVFVYAEQGLGDTIHFYRFAIALQRMGARVLLSVQDRLVRLLRGSGCPITVEGARFVPEVFDYHIALSSLPLALNSQSNPMAELVPYIRPESSRVEFWRERLGPEGLKVGISWQGATNGDGRRAMALSEFHSLARVAGVRLISLQKGAGSEQLPDLRTVERLDGVDEGPDAFVDTAAILHGLDLVITLDSAIAHLAGASGRPVWVALRAVPDWRWFLERHDSPWYPRMRLFRQCVEGNWSAPFYQMMEALALLASEKRCI